MAYLLIPFATLSIAAGAGALALVELLVRLSRISPSAVRSWLLVVVLLPWSLFQAALNLSRGISLRDFTAAE